MALPTLNADLAIDLRNVTKVYKGRLHALRGIEMRVRRGEVFGLLGPNGAGKSTLVKIMMTVVRPTRAEGTLLGARIGDKRTLARVGYLPESHRFPRYLTGRQVVEFFAALAKVPRATRRRRAAELIELVGMSGAADRVISGYSKGMAQRIGLAQALANDPDLVLLDEPTDGVDPEGRRDIREVLARLREQGKTVFINSHLLSELEVVSDRVAILVGGRVARQGTIDELTVANHRYEIEFVPDRIRPIAELVGRAVRGVFPAEVTHAATVGASPPLLASPPEPSPGDGASAAPALAGGPPALPPVLPYAAGPAPSGPPPVPVVVRGRLPAGPWAELNGATLSVGTVDPADIQGLIDACRAAGLVIRRVQPVRPSLEDLFLEAVAVPAAGATKGAA